MSSASAYNPGRPMTPEDVYLQEETLRIMGSSSPFLSPEGQFNIDAQARAIESIIRSGVLYAPYR